MTVRQIVEGHLIIEVLDRLVMLTVVGQLVK